MVTGDHIKKDSKNIVKWCHENQKLIKNIFLSSSFKVHLLIF